jgi:hypothetical protein
LTQCRENKPDVADNFKVLLAITSVSWCVYPVMWVIGSEGLAAVSLDIEVGFICLADLVAKVGPLPLFQSPDKSLEIPKQTPSRTQASPFKCLDKSIELHKRIPCLKYVAFLMCSIHGPPRHPRTQALELFLPPGTRFGFFGLASRAQIPI